MLDKNICQDSNPRDCIPFKYNPYIWLDMEYDGYYLFQNRS